MNFFQKNKGNLVSILVIFGLFIGTIYIRNDKLNLPISPEYEWISAHTLITCEIWDQGGGPSQYGFNPIYTYQGEGSKGIGSFGGVMNDEGEHFYVSYPPMGFIFAYYTTKIFGGPDIYSLRIIGVILHFFCALLIYLIIRKISLFKNDQFSIGALFGAFLYLFSSGTLWLHGLLYFADVLVQLFLILSIYLLIRLFKEDFKKPWRFILLMGVIAFLGCYTEWLAVFFAFFSGLLLLVLYFIKKKKVFLKAFLSLGIGASLAVGIAITQYSSIAGFERLKDVSANKYAERSGHGESTEDHLAFTMSDRESHELLIHNLDRNFAMATNLVGLFSIFLIPFLIWRKTREKLKSIDIKIYVIGLLGISILMHYLLFYNFNAIHNFSNLKTGFFMILITGIVTLSIEETLEKYWKLGLLAVVLFFGIQRSIRDVKRFQNFYSYEDFNQDRMFSAEMIQEHHDPDQYVFMNIHPTAGYLYAAKHIPYPLTDSTDLTWAMDIFNVDRAQYYHHEGQELQFIATAKLVDGEVLLTEKIYFD